MYCPPYLPPSPPEMPLLPEMKKEANYLMIAPFL